MPPHLGGSARGCAIFGPMGSQSLQEIEHSCQASDLTIARESHHACRDAGAAIRAVGQLCPYSSIRFACAFDCRELELANFYMPTLALRSTAGSLYAAFYPGGHAGGSHPCIQWMPPNARPAVFLHPHGAGGCVPGFQLHPGLSYRLTSNGLVWPPRRQVPVTVPPSTSTPVIWAWSTRISPLRVLRTSEAV